MKTLKTLLLLLLCAGGVMAQPLPDNMFISGYVLDANGQAIPSHIVCVSYISNSPTLPSDSVCTSTNNNGYYYVEIVNGSVTGPNVDFEVTIDDPCSFLPLSQTVSNGQGSVDVATADFTICANSGCNGLMAEITATPDTSGGTLVTTLTVTASGGTPGYTYLWDNNSIGGSITVSTPGIYCATVTDANGCSFTACDTVPDPNQGCNVSITTVVDSSGGGLIYTLMASGVFSQYVWSNNQVGQSITLQNISPNGEVICVSATDGNGCVATACDTLLPINNAPCHASLWYPGSPSGTMSVGDTLQLVFDGIGSNQSTYAWTVSAGGVTFSATGANPIFVLPPTLVPINGLSVEICVTVTDTVNNCTDTYCETVLAVPSNGNNCFATFSWVESTILGSPLPAAQFTDLSQDAVSWFWDFGDNNFSTDQNPLHSYNGAGSYNVCLTITTANGCSSTSCQSIVLASNNGCDASFTSSGLTPIGYTFSANVQNANLYYYWELDGAYLGDGYDAYVPGLTTGTHTVCLTIIDSLVGCSDQQCQTITVGNNVCEGYISGQVYAGSNNQPLFNGVVYLITLDTNTNQLTAVDSIVLDTSNSFFFGALSCGDYMIKAAAYAGSPYYSNYIPTYYGNSPFWGFAQTVSVQANSMNTADVTLIAANNPGGPGFIGGDVNQGANKTDPGDPLEGMQVVLFDMSSTAIAYTYTDANGSFGFDNLAYGTYQVYVEALGVQTIPALVTISATEPSVEDVLIFASESLISVGINEFDFEGAISEIYPNPVVNTATVNFNLEVATDVNVSILDLTGRTVSTQSTSLSAGNNTLSVNANGLTEGYYFLNVQDANGNFSVTRKFMRID